MNADGTISVAANVAEGTYDVEYKICEVTNPSNCDQATATITVTASILETQPDTYTVNGSTGGTTPSIYGNDKLNGNPLNPNDVTATIVDNGGLPGVTINPDGTINVPAGMPSGSYTIEVNVCEKLNPGNCKTETVTIQILYPVVANADVVTTKEKQPVTVNILSNDVINNRPIVLTITKQPAHGTIVVNPDLTVTYTPNANYNGTDSFTYQICAQDITPTQCSSADVTVNVSPMITYTDNYTTPHNTPVSFNISKDAVEQANGKVSVTLNPAHGKIVVNADNTITYTPDMGFTGEDKISYEVCVNGNCSIHNVLITVLPEEALKIYNLVTPNGDGLNDYLHIEGIEKYPNNKFEVFNRWGDKIKVITNYNNGSNRWDGTNKENTKVPDGTYWYKLEISGQKTIIDWVLIRNGHKN